MGLNLIPDGEFPSVPLGMSLYQETKGSPHSFGRKSRGKYRQRCEAKQLYHCNAPR